MSEASEQKEVITWYRATYPQWDRSIRLSMNGIKLNGGKQASMIINSMKAQGMTKHESDLCFLVPRGTFHGLVIEMKPTDWNPKKMSQKQRKDHQGQLDYLDYMDGLGYMAALCIGKESAIDTIRSYLKLSS